MKEDSKCPVTGKSGRTTAGRVHIEPRLVAEPAEPGHSSPARAGLQPNGPRIWNAMIAAETMTGWQGRTVNAIPHDLLRQAGARYARRD